MLFAKLIVLRWRLLAAPVVATGLVLAGCSGGTEADAEASADDTTATSQRDSGDLDDEPDGESPSATDSDDESADPSEEDVSSEDGGPEDDESADGDSADGESDADDDEPDGDASPPTTRPTGPTTTLAVLGGGTRVPDHINVYIVHGPGDSPDADDIEDELAQLIAAAIDNGQFSHEADDVDVEVFIDDWIPSYDADREAGLDADLENVTLGRVTESVEWDTGDPEQPRSTTSFTDSTGVAYAELVWMSTAGTPKRGRIVLSGGSYDAVIEAVTRAPIDDDDSPWDGQSEQRRVLAELLTPAWEAMADDPPEPPEPDADDDTGDEDDG